MRTSAQGSLKVKNIYIFLNFQNNIENVSHKVVINTLFIALFINFQPTVSSRTPGASKTAKYILSHLIKYDIRSLNKIIAATSCIQHVFIMPIVLNSLKVTELLLLLLQSIKQPARQKISKHISQGLSRKINLPLFLTSLSKFEQVWLDQVDQMHLTQPNLP